MKETHKFGWFRTKYPPGFEGSKHRYATKIPVRMGHGLSQHLIENKYLKKGDIVIDPFAGTGSLISIMSLYGFQCFGREIVPQFVDLSKDVIDKICYRPEYGKFPKGRPNGLKTLFHPIMEVGDALELRQFRPNNPTAIVTCLPVPQGRHCNGKGVTRGRIGDECGKNPEQHNEYNLDPRNLGNQTGEKYWSSIDSFLDQANMVLPPNGLLVAQITNYTEDKKVVEFDKALESHLTKMNFKIEEIIVAWRFDKPKPSFRGINKRKFHWSWYRETAVRHGSPPIYFEPTFICRRGEI